MNLKSFTSRHEPFKQSAGHSRAFPTSNHLSGWLPKPSYHCFNIGKIKKKIVILFRKPMSQLCFCNFGTFV